MKIANLAITFTLLYTMKTYELLHRSFMIYSFCLNYQFRVTQQVN